jgi:hypothetical protein
MGLVEAIAEEGTSTRKYRISIGRDELNLAEFPLTSLARRIPEGATSLVFEDKIRDQSDGSLITRRLTISGDETYGLPNAWDEDVIVALIQVTKHRNNFTDRTVSFSRYDLVQLLGWPDNGQSLRRLDESLNRWLGVTLRYEKAWWDKIAKSWVNEGFHMLDNLSLYDKETLRSMRRNSAQNILPFSSFTWNKVVFRSFQAENLKTLDLDLYFRLKHPTSKRAYRFLDKRFYRNLTLEFDLRDFACEHVGLSKEHDVGQLKHKIYPALEELEQAGFLEPLPKEQRFTKKGPGDWRITLVRSSARKTTDPVLGFPSAQSADEKPEHVGHVKELIVRGVTPSTAEELAANYSSEALEAKLDVFDWLVESKDKRVAKSPAGYLVKSIQNEYSAPKGFVTKAERQRRAEAKQAKDQAAAEERRRKQEEEACERAEREAGDQYWKSLTSEQQAALDEAAIAQADPETAKLIAGPMRKMGMMLIRQRYIQQLLEAANQAADV